MLKKIFCLLLIFLLPINTFALREKVTLVKCVDGDTAIFLIKNQQQSTRFLAIDTPESYKRIMFYGKEASLYTCDRLSNAKTIELESDNNSFLYDKYNRYLAWVFVDDRLLQFDLVRYGYAKVAYLFGNYKYTDDLKKALILAKREKLGIWKNKK